MYMLQGRALLGGTFNPFHIGHMRLALEILDSLPQHVAQVDLIPCANPPHKIGDAILPFELRAELVEKACAPFPHLHVNRLEGKRAGYSYTWDTLMAYRQDLPKAPLYFILGSDDFVQLSTWKRGFELPQLADMIIIPRDGVDAQHVVSTAHTYWPCLKQNTPLRADALCLKTPMGGSLHILPIPRLDISATLIRQHWLQGKSIHFLVPTSVQQHLALHSNVVRCHWQQENV